MGSDRAGGGRMILQLTPLEAARWAHHLLWCDRLRGNSKSCLGMPYHEPSIQDLKDEFIAGLNGDNRKRLLSELVL